MTHGRIYWIRATLGAIVAEAAQIACAIGWVAVYSHVLAPGQTLASYQAYAQHSGPWVSVIAGVPIFYAASRWIARSRLTGLALFAIFVLVDGGLIVLATAAATTPAPLPIAFIAASYLTKLVACYLGGRRGERSRTSAPASD